MGTPRVYRMAGIGLQTGPVGTIQVVGGQEYFRGSLMVEFQISNVEHLRRRRVPRVTLSELYPSHL